VKSRSVVVLCDVAGRVGGAESYLERILPELGNRGISITVIARCVNDTAFGIPVREVQWSEENEPPNPGAAENLARILAELAPDAVMLSSVFDEAVIRVARRAPRLVVKIYDHRLFCPNGDRRFPQFAGNCRLPMGTACAANALLHGCMNGPRLRSLSRLRARRRLKEAALAADAFVVGSTFMRAECVQNGVDPSRLIVARPPLAAEDFAPSPAPMPPVLRVLFAGRILPQKGLQSLVRAIARIPQARRPVLAVAGATTPELVTSHALAARLRVELEHLGRLDPPALRAAIDAATVVAMPSLWDEPYGLFGAEAQARGRPAVAYDVGGIREWLGAAGIAVRAGDEAALASAIEDVTARDRWMQYSARAFELARAYQPDVHLAKLTEAFFGAPPFQIVA
jgi:glycosyltransferase involved in cell wall biosynthesis